MKLLKLKIENETIKIVQEENEIITKRKITNMIQKYFSVSSAGFEANTEYQEEYASVLDEKISELHEIVENSDIIFEVKEMLENGELKGDKGDDGENGTDGHNGVDGQDGIHILQVHLHNEGIN